MQTVFQYENSVFSKMDIRREQEIILPNYGAIKQLAYRSPHHKEVFMGRKYLYYIIHTVTALRHCIFPDASLFVKNYTGDSKVGIVSPLGFNKILKVIRLNPVIRINEAVIFSFRDYKAGVAGGRDPLILLMNNFYATVSFALDIAYLAGFIGTSVINKNQFPVSE